MRIEHVKAVVAAGAMVAGGAVAQAQTAVQWRVEDGGNGHWYQRVGVDTPGQTVCWAAARDACRAVGGDLVSITSQAEETFLTSACSLGGWIGFQPNGFWSSGEPVVFTHWGPGQPSGDGPYAAAYDGCDGRWRGLWNDIGGSGGCWNGLASYTIEWSADCNHDGIIDYGQILAGQLADANGNGVPDCCEGATDCFPGDIFVDHRVDGADLAAVLSHWGAVSSDPASIACDLDHSGRVDGTDLGILLAHWGPCGQ